MKKTIGITLLVVIIILAAIVGFVRFQQTKEPVKIGAILSFSSPAGPAPEVHNIKEGMVLALDELNARGGINGREIALVEEDPLTNPDKGRELFEKIEAEHQPLFYVSTHSSVSNAIAPLAERQNVVLITIAKDPSLTRNRDWVFRYWPSAEVEVTVVITLLESLGVADLGVLYLNDELGRSEFEVLKREFEKDNHMLHGEMFDPQQSDFKEAIARLKDRQAIFAVGLPQHLTNIFRQLKESGFNGFILSTTAAAGPDMVALPEANGVYVAAPLLYNPNFIFAKDLKATYEALSQKPFNHYVAIGYDTMQLLASLLEGEELSRNTVQMILEDGFVYPGVFGTIDMKRGEHDISFPIHPAQIMNGELKYRY